GLLHPADRTGIDMAHGDKVRFKIRRRASAESEAYWEEFALPWEPMMNVIAALMEIQRNPVNAAGEKTTPVVYSSNCLEEVCGSCLEACPNYGPHSDFIGAAPINQARLFNLHPSGAMQAKERLDALQDEGGIGGCGNAQNCVMVCPKEIPLTTSLADMMRATA